MALIPVLPQDLLDFLEAPIPLLAGITRAQFEQVQQLLSPEQMQERVWVDADTGKVSWGSMTQEQIPVFDFCDLWLRLEPLWSGLQHSIRKYTNQKLYWRSQQPSSLIGVNSTHGRGTPTGMPSQSQTSDFTQRRGSNGSVNTNKSADFGNFRTVQHVYSGVSARKQFMVGATRIANQNWLDLPSPEMRTKSLEICRLISEQIKHHILEGCLQETLERSPITYPEVEHLQQRIVTDANPEDKAFISKFVATQMFFQYIEENCEIKIYDDQMS